VLRTHLACPQATHRELWLTAEFPDAFSDLSEADRAQTGRAEPALAETWWDAC
jgi:hypothetical protein